MRQSATPPGGTLLRHFFTAKFWRRIGLNEKYFKNLAHLLRQRLLLFEGSYARDENNVYNDLIDTYSPPHVRKYQIPTPFFNQYAVFCCSVRCSAVFWRVHRVLESVTCSGECTLFWRVHHVLESAPCSGECTLFWRVYRVLESVPYSGECTVFWRVYPAEN